MRKISITPSCTGNRLVTIRARRQICNNGSFRKTLIQFILHVLYLKLLNDSILHMHLLISFPRRCILWLCWKHGRRYPSKYSSWDNGEVPLYRQEIPSQADPMCLPDIRISVWCHFKTSLPVRRMWRKGIGMHQWQQQSQPIILWPISKHSQRDAFQMFPIIWRPSHTATFPPLRLNSFSQKLQEQLADRKNPNSQVPNDRWRGEWSMESSMLESPSGTPKRWIRHGLQEVCPHCCSNQSI